MLFKTHLKKIKDNFIINQYTHYKKGTETYLKKFTIKIFKYVKATHNGKK